uniref:Peptidase S1 domain-containing protein n=2 Tax=Rhodnius prolixus TaxID=13249 RepID=T1H7U5_RHOPR
MRRVFQFMMKTVISNYSLVEIASVTDLPYVVLVETSLRICFGVLIDALWVLTVAHCFGPLRTAMVVAGTTHWEKSNNKIQSYEVIIHPDYKKTKNIFQESSDLALIRLRDPILLTSDTKILQLEAEPWPQQSSEMYHRTCTTVGYTMGTSNNLSLHAYVTTAQHGHAGCACYGA